MCFFDKINSSTIVYALKPILTEQTVTSCQECPAIWHISLICVSLFVEVRKFDRFADHHNTISKPTIEIGDSSVSVNEYTGSERKNEG